MLNNSFFLLRELIRRDFQGRYAGSWLGLLWSFAQPLWQFVLFSFVFSAVLRVSPLGERTDSFAAFLLCGLLPWVAFSEGVQRSATAITDNGNLVKKLRFPSQVLVATVVGTALLHQAIATVLFVVFLLLRGELAVGGMILLLLALPLQLLLTLGLGLLLASIHVFFRDVSQLLGMLFSGWFYLTPIVYPIAMVPPRFRTLIEANPLTALVELYREAFLGGDLHLPAGTGWLTLVALASFSLGALVFSRCRHAFADEL